MAIDPQIRRYQIINEKLECDKKNMWKIYFYGQKNTEQ